MQNVSQSEKCERERRKVKCISSLMGKLSAILCNVQVVLVQLSVPYAPTNIRRFAPESAAVLKQQLPVFGKDRQQKWVSEIRCRVLRTEPHRRLESWPESKHFITLCHFLNKRQLKCMNLWCSTAVQPLSFSLHVRVLFGKQNICASCAKGHHKTIHMP